MWGLFRANAVRRLLISWDFMVASEAVAQLFYVGNNSIRPWSWVVNFLVTSNAGPSLATVYIIFAMIAVAIMAELEKAAFCGLLTIAPSRGRRS